MTSKAMLNLKIEMATAFSMTPKNGNAVFMLIDLQVVEFILLYWMRKKE